MRKNLVKPTKLNDLIAPVFLGISGAFMGSTYGSGVGKSLPELSLALFLIILASIFSIENLLLRSREYLLILISGAVVGLVIEYFTQSTIVIVIVGGFVGICTLPLLSRIRSFIEHFLQTAPLIYNAILLVIGFAIFSSLYFWASSRGILMETLIAISFLTSPLWVGYLIWKLQ